MPLRHAVFAICTGTIALAACGERQARSAAPVPVFLISIDTLRSDRLPVYGYTNVSTPHIDAFRADSVLYEKAFSHCPLTLPSHATVLTGQLPAGTAIRDNVGYQLDPRVPTLAEILGKRGYRSGAAVSSFVLRKNTGIHRGFDFYDDQFGASGAVTAIGEIQRAGPDTVAIATSWIAANAASPLFFMLHLYEPHAPYAPPEPYRSRYSHPYDGEVAYSDQLVGEFLSFLRQQGLYDRSLIILFSDHGEGLGDHGEEEHGIFVYREALQVPLLVKLPAHSMAGKSVATPVQLSDVFSTVADATGTPAGAVAGKSLLSFLTDAPQTRFVYSETYYPKFHFGWSDLHSLTDGTHHLIQAPRPELYQIERDPGERSNVLEESRRTYAAMHRVLQPFIQAADTPAAIDAEDAARLAALGYLSGGVRTAPGEVLPDPKDTLSTFAEIRKAFSLSRRHEIGPALAVTNSLLNANPRMVDLWDLKARLLAVQGKQLEAIAAAREGLRLSPNASHLALLIATLALEVGDDAQAEQHAALVLKTEPARAHDLLARVWIARGDLDRAEEQARASLASEKDRALALVTLARVEKERGNYSESLKYLDAAVRSLGARKSRTINNLHYLRGDVLARLGRIEEAEAAFREEIRLFPEEPRAYKNLIILCVSGGRIAEGTALIRQLADTAPTPLSFVAIIDVLKTVGDDRGVRFWASRARDRYPDDRRFRGL